MFGYILHSITSSYEIFLLDIKKKSETSVGKPSSCQSYKTFGGENEV